MKGHQSITAASAAMLFEKCAVGGRLWGLDLHHFTKRLIEAVEKPDSIWGDTWKPACSVPDAQAAHSLAKFHQPAAKAIADIKDYVHENIEQGHWQHANAKSHSPNNAEWEALGRALHALQDSYSGAHMFRDTKFVGDPSAKITAVLFFDWDHPWSHTHDSSFDQVMHESNGAIKAVAGILRAS
jgi:hypothetical protein